MISVWIRVQTKPQARVLGQIVSAQSRKSLRVQEASRSLRYIKQQKEEAKARLEQEKQVALTENDKTSFDSWYDETDLLRTTLIGNFSRCFR